MSGYCDFCEIHHSGSCCHPGRAKLEALRAENRLLMVKTTNSLANNLCPDHRDKQQGKSCLACENERLGNELEIANRSLIEAGADLRAENERLAQDARRYRAALQSVAMSPDPVCITGTHKSQEIGRCDCAGEMVRNALVNLTAAEDAALAKERV